MYTIEPIAFVKNERKKIEDDYWGGILSEIILSEKLSAESLKGIEEFSHLEIIFYFHKADPEKINISASHPRSNKSFPQVGIFSQRKKARPNLLGTSIVKIISVSGNRLRVEGLDAIDGTPVIDIKPVMKEFLPDGIIRQPEWVSGVMKDYWETGIKKEK